MPSPISPSPYSPSSIHHIRKIERLFITGSLHPRSPTAFPPEGTRPWYKRWTLAYPVLTVLFLGAVFSTLAIRKTNERGKRVGLEVLGVEEIPEESITFQLNPTFSGPSSEESDGAWMEVLGPGKGFFSIDHASLWEVPPGIREPEFPADTETFGVSMFHQLQCLIEIRHLLFSSLRGEGNSTSRSENMTRVGQCFDYLRQGIMCAGDTTVEGVALDMKVIEKRAKKRTEINMSKISGWGWEHKCKSFSATRKWMDSHLPIKGNESIEFFL
ncbi:hypothetical protein BGZ60DRAFT_407845 [Tricladium varicosporioides]|nr:hypothetical protein BGZ60DRAFT_407845 [Hymenoscyphus varicosporioides]